MEMTPAMWACFGGVLAMSFVIFAAWGTSKANGCI